MTFRYRTSVYPLTCTRSQNYIIILPHNRIESFVLFRVRVRTRIEIIVIFLNIFREREEPICKRVYKKPDVFRNRNRPPLYRRKVGQVANRGWLLKRFWAKFGQKCLNKLQTEIEILFKCFIMISIYPFSHLFFWPFYTVCLFNEFHTGQSRS